MDEKTSHARYEKMQGKTFRNEDGSLMEGDIFKNGVIMRFHNGLLDGQGESAIDCEDGHIEFWENGYIKIVGNIRGGYKEFWKDGVRIEK